MLTPVQTAVSHNLGDRTAAYLYDRLTDGLYAEEKGHLLGAALAFHREKPGRVSIFLSTRRSPKVVSAKARVENVLMTPPSILS